ncbi:hypothetical protein FACS1894111_00680 [Clostridia bacterium]|nr:hypothetical protein FACS1894111_00680 [Clostridia bacterium]
MDSPEREQLILCQAELRSVQLENRKLHREIKRHKKMLDMSVTTFEMTSSINKTIMDEMAEFEKYLKWVLANSEEMTLFFDENEKLVIVSESFLRFYKIQTKAQIIGKSATQLLHDRGNQQVTEYLMLALNEMRKNKRAVETMIKSLQGYYLLVRLVPLSTTGNEFMYSMSDVTGLVRLRDEAIAAKESAIRSDKIKSGFLSHMNHEVWTPLNAITDMAQTGQQAQDVNKKESCLKKIEESSKLLLGIIDDILDLSNIESDKLMLKVGVVDLPKLISNVVDGIEQQVQEKKLNLSITIDPALPKFIYADGKRLFQVFMNLLSNAVKFTSLYGNVGLSVKKLADLNRKITLRCVISDDGIGISKEAQKTLFRAFEQTDNSISSKSGGTGLELVIAKRIVELMGGTVWLESEEGKGSKFYFEIVVEEMVAEETH